jgi:hypothetical protein
VSSLNNLAQHWYRVATTLSANISLGQKSSGSGLTWKF